MKREFDFPNVNKREGRLGMVDRDFETMFNGRVARIFSGGTKF